MSLHRRRRARSAQADLVRARRCPELPGRAEKPGHVVLGVSATGDVGIAATLAAEWLASVFGRAFTPVRTGESSLGVEAFYDAVSYPIGEHAFVAAIRLEENSARRAASRPASSSSHAEQRQLVDAGDQITLHFEGIAHAHFNPVSGQALVMFDHLPGAIELLGEPAPTLALRSDAQAPRAEAVAWYGFGTLQRRHSGVRRGLRSGISHGRVEGELQSLLAEYV